MFHVRLKMHGKRNEKIRKSEKGGEANKNPERAGRSEKREKKGRRITDKQNGRG